MTRFGNRAREFFAAAMCSAAARSTMSALAVAVCAVFVFVGEARAQTAGVPGKPVVRAVEADFAIETFTLRWHAPKVKGDSQITAYRVRRSQNNIVIADDADPDICTTLAESDYRYLAPGDITDSSKWYEHSTSPRGDPNVNPPGISFGNCYRWHISAVNSQGAGEEAVTPPILSRGLVLGPSHAQFAKSYDTTSDAAGTDCPAGQFRIRASPDDWANICLAREHIEGADRCQRLDTGSLEADYTTGASLAGARCRLSPASVTSCEQHGFTREDLSGGLLICSITTQCGAFSEYNIAHRACQCEGLATPAAEGNYAECQCAVGGADPTTCQCPADRPYNPLDNSCGPSLAELLAADTVDLDLVRVKLSAGADPNRRIGNSPVLIFAATLGLAEVVSVLITAGADPDARQDGFVDGLNAMHYMAGHQLTAITRQRKWEVMRHFGDAVSVRGTTFAWDALYDVPFEGLSPVGMLQRAGEQTGADNVPAVMEEMSNYMIRRGGRCPRGTPGQRFHDYCLGDLGVAVVSLALDKPDATRAEVERSLQTALDGGLATLVMLGHPDYGHLAIAAAARGRATVMSVLITAGAGYGSGAFQNRGPRDRNIEQHSALLAATRPADALAVLRHYIGALSVIGASPGGWNQHLTLLPFSIPWDGFQFKEGADSPLQLVDNSAKTWVNANPDGVPFVRSGHQISGTPHPDILEIQSLIVEYGGKCRWHGGNPLCYPPAQDVDGFAARDFVGAVLTITARALAGFKPTPGGAAVAANLAANGWTLSLDATPDPDEAALYRTRAARAADASAVFTLTLTNAAANAAGLAMQARYVRVFGELESTYGVSMIAAMRDGEWDTAREHLGRLSSRQTDLTDGDGISPLIIAATLGNAPMVAALVTFGFDPDARSTYKNSAVPHLMTDTGATDLTLGLRAEILYSFGGALATRGADFNWNAENADGARAMDLLRSATGDQLIGEMADYMLARGGECEPKKIWHPNERYHRACTGGMGVTLAAAALTGSAQEVRDAAQAIKDAGVAFTVGVADGGEIITNPNRHGFTISGARGGDIIGNAARLLRGEAISILITFGLDPDSITGADSFTPGHWLAYGVRGQNGGSAAKGAEALDYLLGGLAVSDRWADYEHWNTGDDSGDFRYPLDILRVHGGQSTDEESKKEIQALIYEGGGRCRFAPADPDRSKTGYCALPEESQGVKVPLAGLGFVANITTRRHAQFDAASISPSVRASLSARGWTLAVSEDAPRGLRVERLRFSEEGDGPAVFTATLTNWAGEAARRVDVSLDFAESRSLSDLLALRVTNLAEVRSALRDENLDLDGTLDGAPYLIYAATLGYAGIVSVLITAGANPDARHNGFVPGLNAMHYMAGHQLTSITRRQKWEVMRHFGDAVDIREAASGTKLFPWDSQYQVRFAGLSPPTMLQRAGEQTGADNVPEVMRQMSDYMMRRGGRCWRGTYAQRYHDYCLGDLGLAVVSLAMHKADATREEVEQVIQAAVDGGLQTLIILGHPIYGQAPLAAASQGRALAMSVLITAGAGYNVRAGDDLNIPQYSAILAETRPADALAVMRHYIGAVSVIGATPGGWDHHFDRVPATFPFTGIAALDFFAGGDGRALRRLNDSAKRWVAANPDGVPFSRGGQTINEGTPHPDILEIQALIWEHGGTCRFLGGNPLCYAPEENYVETLSLEVSHVGGVLTMTARAHSYFKSPLLAPELLSTLEASGWTLAINTGAEPDEVVLERRRAKQRGDKAAVFTLIMTNSAGRESRFFRVSVNLNSFLNLLRGGEPSADAVTTVLESELPDEHLDGVPVLIVAATLGYEVAVSILITAGANPDARSAAHARGNVAHLMAAGTGTDLSRTEKGDLLLHFSNALSIRATVLDWNAADDNGGIPLRLLRTAAGTESGGDLAVIAEMGDLIFANGGRCGAESSAAARYHSLCLGPLGRDVVAAALYTVYTEATADEFRQTLRAAISVGYAIDDFGTPEGELPPAAAAHGRGIAMSILITAGGNYGRTFNGLAIPQIVGTLVRERPAAALEALRGFIGALSVRGETYGDWNRHRSSASGPLDRLNANAKTWVNNNSDGVPFTQGGQTIPGTPHPDILEAQALMYEHGANCRWFGGNPLCFAPEQSASGAADILDTGAILTITARALSGFKAAVVAPEVAATLEASGWTVSLNAAADPDEAALIRARVALAADRPANFTVTLTNAAARDTRIIHVAGALEASVFRDLLATLSPNLASLRQALDDGASPNSVLDGVPVLILAATLGHAGAVSVLITAGADPGATHDEFGFAGLNAMHYMAGHQVTISRADKWEVMRHFSAAVSLAPAATFDWAARTEATRQSALDFLRIAGKRSGADNAPATMTLMADHMLARGGRCWVASYYDSADRFHDLCIGTLGKEFVDLVGRNTDPRPTADEVRRGIQKLTDSGFADPREMVGVSDRSNGRLAAYALLRGNPAAMSVLVTAGWSDLGPIRFGEQWQFGMLHVMGWVAANNKAAGLVGLRHYLGALEETGQTLPAGYGSSDEPRGWNQYHNSGSQVHPQGIPLLWLRSRAGSSYRDSMGVNFPEANPDVAEMGAIMYEHGARCDQHNAYIPSPQYHGICFAPAEEYSILAPPSFVVGGIVTMTARVYSSFRPTLVAAGIAATLEQSGWTLSVNTAADPDEAVLHRLRAPEPGDSPAMFTVQLTNHLNQEVRFFRVSVDVADSAEQQLIFAVRRNDVAETRRLLSTLGLASVTMEPRDENNFPLLIEAARSGYAEIVSVLVTFGVNPDVRHPTFFNLHVAHLMATWDGTPQPGGGELPRADRLNVLRHFGDALAVRGTLFDWNTPDMNNNHFEFLLGLSEDREPAESDPLLQEMADYALTRGMHCGHISKANASARYGKYCAGTRGAAMAAVVQASGGAGTVSIVAAAVSLTDAGFPLLAAGDPTWGGIVERAAFNGNAAAVSILITFGGDAEVPDQVRGVPHQAARSSQWNPAGALNVLRHFIGGLSVAGKLSSYGSWSRNSDLGAPLEIMNAYSTSTNETHQAQYAEMHSLLYEQGSRCDSDATKYCAIPTDNYFGASEIGSAGAVFTMTARANAGFHSPPVPESVRDNLERNGWTYLLNAGAAPAELTLFRIYAPTNADEPVLSLTITLTSSAGTAVRHLRALATLAVVRPPGYEAFVSVALSGDADETSRLYSPNLLNLRTEEGPALLVAAATLGHAEVVSVLVTLGYNPDARLGARNIARLMADASPATLDYGRRWEVLRHFADAMDARGTMLADWQDGQPMNSLRGAYDGADAADKDAMLLMGDYYLARGAFCVGGINYRYRPPCVGSFGITLKDYANQTGGSPPDDDVRAAARAVVDAGIPVDLLGVNGAGKLVGLAAHRNNAGIVSILITFGFDPSGRGGTGGRVDWTAPHHAAAAAENNAPRGLNMLQHFIGGLHESGRLTLFADWNADSNQGRPLDILQSGASANADNLEEKLEMHSLLYELGATCASDTTGYCGVPAEDFSASEVQGLGGVFTITARMFSGFAATLVSESAASVLTASGWGLTLVSDAAPEELVLTRARAAVPSDLDAVFTVALTSRFHGRQSRFARASVALAEVADEYELLLSAVRSGDAGETERLAPLYVNALDDGVPLPIIAATLGHAEVVSVLIATGFDSSVSYSGDDILRLMTRRDAATLAYEKRRDVLFAFGAAVGDSQEAFDWNNGLPMNDLRAAYGGDGVSSAEQNAILQMGNYLLARGAACTGDNFTRYNSPCIGTYGETLSPLANMSPGSPSDDAVRTAMQAAADAGINLDILGAPFLGALPGLAASRGHSGMVSILLTFGMNPSAQGGIGGTARAKWTALHHAAITVDDNADKSLELIQHFIGGLRGAGSLDSFSDWNPDSSRGRPLDIFQEFASRDDDGLAAKREAQALLYERGARCESGGAPYCDVPTEEGSALEVSGLGPALTVFGRGVSGEGFSVLSTIAGKGAELLANGWEVSVVSGSPAEMIFARARLWESGDMTVALTVSLLVGAESVREYRLVLSSAELMCGGMNRQEEEGSAAGSCGACLPGFDEMRGRCVDIGENGDYGLLPQEEVCEILWGDIREVGGGRVCVGADEVGTFCILGSRDAFPCHGFFRRILRCNLHNRPGMNPFVCGAVCDSGKAEGAACRN